MRIATIFFLSFAIVPTAQAMSSAMPPRMEQINFTTYLRAGPGTDYRPTDEAQTGQIVQVGKCANGWCEVSYESASGYVAQNTLEPMSVGTSHAASHCILNHQAGYHGSDGVVLCTSPHTAAR